MSTDEQYMLRCLELARLGAGSVSPNPMVGCVVVHQGNIIGEGWHRQYGGPHAEVNAIAAVSNKELLKESTVYVNLEPCSHFGKTPPCADLLVKYQVKKVVVGMIDPFAAVSGSGIQKLESAGIAVKVGVLEQECRQLNKRFITFHTRQRPYIILKWAETADGRMAPDASQMDATTFAHKRLITDAVVQAYVHKWRGAEDAVLVGTKTVLTDNPLLDTRAYPGKNPLRITFDRRGIIPADAHIFNGLQPTLVFTDNPLVTAPNNQVSYVQIDFTESVWPQVWKALHTRQVVSVIVEGGAATLHSLIEAGWWDEAQVFRTKAVMGNGTSAPKISGVVTHQLTVGNSELTIYNNA